MGRADVDGRQGARRRRASSSTAACATAISSSTFADWPVFTRYMSPIESKARARIRAIEKPIAVCGSTLSHLRVDSGDWLFGDMDGVVVIPAARVEDVLKKAEEIGGIEDEIRDQIRAGADVRKVFEKYGRL